MSFHRIPYMFEPEFAADPDAIARVASYQAGACLSTFGPNNARPSVAAAPATTSAAAPAGSGLPENIGLGSGGGGGIYPQPGAQDRPSGRGGGGSPCGLGNVPGDAAGAGPLGTSLTLHVPAGAVGRIIGAGGTNIRALEEKSGAIVSCKAALPSVLPFRGLDWLALLPLISVADWLTRLPFMPVADWLTLLALIPVADWLTLLALILVALARRSR